MRLADVVSSEDMRRLAQRRLPKSVFEFVDGGAEDEQTLSENRAAFQRSHFKPRVLRDVSEPAISTTLWGDSLPAPVVIAPMGSCKLVWPEADVILAQAAAARGIPYTLSTMSSTSIEDMAKAVHGPLWFQLYVLKDMDFNLKLLDRARASNYAALVVTVDLPAGGKRERDLRNGVSIPLRLTARQIFEGVTHPGWSLRLLRGGLPQFENVRGLMGDTSAGMTIAARVGANLHAGFDWQDFARIRDHWSGKLLVKGVMHPEDARQLVDAGADGPLGLKPWRAAARWRNGHLRCTATGRRSCWRQGSSHLGFRHSARPGYPEGARAWCQCRCRRTRSTVRCSGWSGWGG